MSYSSQKPQGQQQRHSRREHVNSMQKDPWPGLKPRILLLREVLTTAPSCISYVITHLLNINTACDVGTTCLTKCSLCIAVLLFRFHRLGKRLQVEPTWLFSLASFNIFLLIRHLKELQE
ncbi:hypothetical protein XENOCAPTIV_030122 [Xenoophorus captivus]|uniref:Uncharacterized protein n=1 Tax=Xenoophorus captivus TaxID=1517983 RepID=A0ABV0SCI8_9TELE